MFYGAMSRRPGDAHGFSTVDMPEVTQHSFVIAVPDLQRSAAFYRDVLGFTIISISDPGWLFFRCGDCTIMAGECPDAIPPAQLGDHSYFAYLQISDVDSLYKSVCDADVKICKTLRDEPWQMREFCLVTADGHRIMFGTPIFQSF
jgi:catechol 2,3-dioxygenase-like lactoylglutathione lyase family enzyme